MQNLHSQALAELIKTLQTDPTAGLSQAEAKARLKSNGENALPDKKPPSLISRFFAQLSDFMTLVLIIAAAVSFAVSALNGDADISEPVIILAIVVLNGVIGVIQESRAEKSLEKLKSLSQPHARVIRGGKETTISAKEVVVGDILLFGAGDIVCADCRLLESVSLSVDESALTGESGESEKDAAFIADVHAPLGDRKNMLYSSSPIISGKCRAAAVAVGADTEMGHIAQLLTQSDNRKTPLQQKLAMTGKRLGLAALLICAAVFMVGLVRHMPVADMFMTSVSLAVAAIPEGLPAVVTIVLALGVVKMSKHNAIVRRLPSVETLGSASVICSDKTGTLTQNRMRVTAVKSHDTALTLRLAAMCSDFSESGRRNPTDRAVTDAAAENGFKKQALDKKYPRIDEIPFSSERKRMTTLHKTFSGYRTISKGAPEYILELCTKIHNGEREIALTPAEKRRILAQSAAMTADALRVIGVCYYDSPLSESREIHEREMVFVGLIGMEDAPRPEAANAVRLCKKAGIRPVMITGDHAGTAVATAVKTGIAQKGERAVTGAELDRMSDEYLAEHIAEFPVFARTAPAHKARIVKAWQSRGAVVAMTGDGVNDAPALSRADIGCSMGISGTEVAKSASDIVLTDDNFATIVYAVREGRAIFDNIRKAVHFLLSSNIGEILTVFAAIVFGHPSPLSAAQLLWINLVTDSLPAIALGLDPPQNDIMSKPPRPKDKSLFADHMASMVVFEGLLIGALSLLAFVIGTKSGGLECGRTMSFTVLAFSELIHAFNMRSEHSVLKIGLFSNKYLALSFIAAVILQAAVVSVPFLAGIFDAVALSAWQWCACAALGIMPLVVLEAQKAFTDRRYGSNYRESESNA